MLNESRFIEKYGAIFEHSDWIARDAYRLMAAQNTKMGAASIHQAMVRIFREAPHDKRMAVLCAHPDLAGKLAQAKRLTPDSLSEQKSAGLDALTKQEHDMFLQLNQRYVAKFGFPFIIAVRENTKSAILRAFQTRIENERDAELAEACFQVERIAYHRLFETV